LKYSYACIGRRTTTTIRRRRRFLGKFRDTRHTAACETESRITRRKYRGWGNLKHRKEGRTQKKLIGRKVQRKVRRIKQQVMGDTRK